MSPVFIVILAFFLFLSGSTCALGCAFVPRFSESLISVTLNDDSPPVKYSQRIDIMGGFLVSIKYRPTALLQKQTIMETPMRSPCVKCAICIAVSEKLNDVLSFANASVDLTDFDEVSASDLLKPVCDYAFYR